MSSSAAAPETRPRMLLVIDYATNWYNVFGKKRLLDGSRVLVEQAEWKDLSLEFGVEEGLVVHIKGNPSVEAHSSRQRETRAVRPDFMLVRNFPTNLHGLGYSALLQGLIASGLPSVNSLLSVFMCTHRPLLYGELLRVQERIGPDTPIRVVPLRFFPNAIGSAAFEDALPPPATPAVVKVGSTHAGYGKSRIRDEADFEDIRSVLQAQQAYYTVEPFIEHEYEYRIQKIGPHVRCFRRNSSTCWKNNRGNISFEDYPVKDHHRVWAEECAKIYGGLDILALDVLHCADGKEVLLELNDTACGLMWDHEEEDRELIAEIVLQSMNEKLCTPVAS